jgi:hypothetical protein
VSPVKRQIYLLLLAVLVLVIALIVLIRNRNIDVDLLAALGILGGLGLIVVALPIRNGNGKGGV